jgi:DNA-binding response OmpR family regulator
VGTPSRLILLVDDSALVRGFTAELLVEAGYQVLEAADAASARRIVEETEDQIDLLMIDVILPGTNGLVLARQLRELRPGLKVLLLSADPANVAAKALLPGAGFLEKSRMVEELAATVAGMLSTT